MIVNSEIDNAIIVFARLPVKGKVKTRLAEDLGIDVATSFYKLCAEHTFKEILKLNKSDVAAFLFYSEESEFNEVSNWTNNKFQYYSQKGHELGDRMLHAFNTIFNSGFRNVILVGTDTPGISAELINNAFYMLKNYKCVIGPSEDGGYYLIGLKQTFFYLFQEVEWSTDAVFSKTIERLKQNNQNYRVMEKLIDIDTKEDLIKWSNKYKSVFAHPIRNFLISNNIIINDEGMN